MWAWQAKIDYWKCEVGKIRKLKNREGFKKQLKQHILEGYKDKLSCSNPLCKDKQYYFDDDKKSLLKDFIDQNMIDEDTVTYHENSFRGFTIQISNKLDDSRVEVYSE